MRVSTQRPPDFARQCGGVLFADRVCGRPELCRRSGAASGKRHTHGTRSGPFGRVMRLPCRDPQGAWDGFGALRPAHPRIGGTRRVHHVHRRLLPSASTLPRQLAREDRTSVCDLAVAVEDPHPPAAPGPWRFSSVEYPVSLRDGVLAARSFPRRIWRSSRRCRVSYDELFVLLFAAERTAGRSSGIVVPPFLATLPRKQRRSRDAERGGAVSCLPRTRDGQSTLVPYSARHSAPNNPGVYSCGARE